MLMLMITTAIIIFLCIFTPPPTGGHCVIMLGPSRIGWLQRLKNVKTVSVSRTKRITFDYQLSGSWRRCCHYLGKKSQKGSCRSWHYAVHATAIGASCAIGNNGITEKNCRPTQTTEMMSRASGAHVAQLTYFSHLDWQHLLRVTNSIFSRAARSAFFRTDLSFYFLSSRKLTLILTVWISVLLLLWIGIFISAFLLDFQT